MSYPCLLARPPCLIEREARIPPHLTQRLHAALDRLVELYFDIDKPDELAKWQAERAKYPK